jgi:hypothetical protein
MKVYISKTNGETETWENCSVDFLPTWLAIRFNDKNGVTSRTFAYPMSDIKQVEVEHDDTED